MSAPEFTPEQLDAALVATGDPELIALARQYLAATEHPLNSWRPRPDSPAEHDQQTGYVNCQSRVQVCLGGTGSGKSDASAYKVAKLLLERKPPRKNTPFWCLSSTFDMSCGVLWGEKLSRFIPKEAIANISWLNAGLEHPRAVRLKPWKGTDHNWIIEFKAEAQRREKLQAASIGGAWISETLNDFSVFTEVQGRLRDYEWASIFWDLTPLVPQVELEEKYKRPPAGWSFFHLNSLKNAALPPGVMEQYLAGLPDEIRETRCIGAFASYEGAVYKELLAQHIIEPRPILSDWMRFRSLDFGNNFACVWLVFDPANDVWYVTHEYYKEGGDLIGNHAEQIKAVPWTTGTTYGDPADPTSIRELGQHGISVAGARKEPKLGAIELVRKLLKGNRLFFFNTCTKTIQQHRAYRWERQHGEKDPRPAPLKHWDHLVDATMYCLYSRVSGGIEIPTKPLEIQRKPRLPQPQQGAVSSRSRPASSLPPMPWLRQGRARPRWWR